jgi:intron-binding protein aquarius
MITDSSVFPVCSALSLQVSQYLEGYLWPFFDPATASDAHVMSILVMVNEKFREGMPAWTGFHTRKVC